MDESIYIGEKPLSDFYSSQEIVDEIFKLRKRFLNNSIPIINENSVPLSEYGRTRDSTIPINKKRQNKSFEPSIPSNKSIDFDENSEFSQYTLSHEDPTITMDDIEEIFCIDRDNADSDSDLDGHEGSIRSGIYEQNEELHSVGKSSYHDGSHDYDEVDEDIVNRASAKDLKSASNSFRDSSDNEDSFSVISKEIFSNEIIDADDGSSILDSDSDTLLSSPPMVHSPDLEMSVDSECSDSIESSDIRYKEPFPVIPVNELLVFLKESDYLTINKEEFPLKVRCFFVIQRKSTDEVSDQQPIVLGNVAFNDLTVDDVDFSSIYENKCKLKNKYLQCNIELNDNCVKILKTSVFRSYVEIQLRGVQGLHSIALVDLSTLKEFDIDGWYILHNTNNPSKLLGQLKIGVRPKHPLKIPSFADLGVGPDSYQFRSNATNLFSSSSSASKNTDKKAVTSTIRPKQPFEQINSDPQFSTPIEASSSSTIMDVDLLKSHSPSIRELEGLSEDFLKYLSLSSPSKVESSTNSMERSVLSGISDKNHSSMHISKESIKSSNKTSSNTSEFDLIEPVHTILVGNNNSDNPPDVPLENEENILSTTGLPLSLLSPDN
eukprot:TRINITY_DN2614_c0_g1_i1.p1 TRINITY_DN2614_c0_g1~~TRINITY_DN2614_c0_g1_i1.p1  ORF type:complete len:605 (+),score=159.09 TRINITY_DN2614_c0_g1_i1:1286-3100(+)